MSQEGVFDNIKPTSFEQVFMPGGAYMDATAMEEYLNTFQCPDGFLKDSKLAMLADFTVVWDSNGICCCKPCPGSNVFGQVHVLEVTFVTK